MSDRLRRVGTWLHARADNLLAAMLFGMFAVFILQIFSRYVINLPIGWTHEISVILWIWLVLFGVGFVVRDEEEIRFDLLYGAVSNRARRIMVVLASAAIVILFGMALPAILDYVLFMKVQRTAYLRIPFDIVYSIFVFFVLATILRHIYLGSRAVMGRTDDVDPTRKSSGI